MYLKSDAIKNGQRIFRLGCEGGSCIFSDRQRIPCLEKELMLGAIESHRAFDRSIKSCRRRLWVCEDVITSFAAGVTFYRP